MSCVNGKSGYVSPVNWARLGASYGYLGGDDRPPPFESSISQDVLIPDSLAADPATLTFDLMILDRPYATGTMRVTIDGQPVFTVTDGAAGYSSYKQVVLPVGSLDGPGPKTLKFEADESIDTGSAPMGSYESDSFEIDDVSLSAPDLPAASGAPPATGQQAAALAKCKKKHSKRARKRCRAAGRLLPI